MITVLTTLLALFLPSPEAQPRPEETSAPGRPVPVAVVDNLSDWNGLGRVLRGWEASGVVDFMLADDCLDGTYCIVVDEYAHGTRWGGLTSPLTPDITHVQMNRSALDEHDVSMQAAFLCHEIGHALGIPHPERPQSAPGCIAGHGGAPEPTDADHMALYDAQSGRNVQSWGALAP